MKKFFIGIGVTFITLVAIALSMFAISPNLEKMRIDDEL